VSNRKCQSSPEQGLLETKLIKKNPGIDHRRSVLFEKNIPHFFRRRRDFEMVFNRTVLCQPDFPRVNDLPAGDQNLFPSLAAGVF
jgi:hypothetical protein